MVSKTKSCMEVVYHHAKFETIPSNCSDNNGKKHQICLILHQNDENQQSMYTNSSVMKMERIHRYAKFYAISCIHSECIQDNT